MIYKISYVQEFPQDRKALQYFESVCHLSAPTFTDALAAFKDKAIQPSYSVFTITAIQDVTPR